MNNYFKNANRGKSPPSTQPYVPEYKRLDAKPVIYPVKDKEELDQMNKQYHTDPKFAAAKFAKGEISQKEFDQIMQARLSAKRPMVSSGETDEPIWIQSGTKKNAPEPEEIRAEEIPTPPESSFLSVDDEGSFTWDKVDPGDYVLLYQENILEIGKGESILQAIEKVGGDINDFIVLKRCNVSRRVSID
jgi:hypothetical protein